MKTAGLPGIAVSMSVISIASSGALHLAVTVS